jgi:hypothetical protein
VEHTPTTGRVLNPALNLLFQVSPQNDLTVAALLAFVALLASVFAAHHLLHLFLWHIIYYYHQQ